MEIKQLFTASIQHGNVIENEDGLLFTNLNIFHSFESLKDVTSKCLSVLLRFEKRYLITIKHEIFERETDYDNLTFEDIVYRYGPITYFLDEKSSPDISDYVILEKCSTSLLYPEDFRYSNKFNVGDKCRLKFTDSPGEYGVIYRCPKSMYEDFDNLKHYRRGYSLISISNEGVYCDWDSISESDLEPLSEPTEFDEWLDLMSKMIKLGMDEAFVFSKVEKTGEEYLNRTDAWKQYFRECMDKISETKSGKVVNRFK